MPNGVSKAVLNNFMRLFVVLPEGNALIVPEGFRVFEPGGIPARERCSPTSLLILHVATL